MRLTIWQGFEKNGKRRLSASTKKELMQKIAERCPDKETIRTFHVWKAFLTPNAEWIHGVIELIGTEFSKRDTELLGREYIKPIEETRCNCFFARNKLIDEEPVPRIASSTTSGKN